MNLSVLADEDQPPGDDRVEYVYRIIRTEILSGELSPGTVISQVQLAARLETSRTPLREALRRLYSEGLVVGDFNRRMRVSELDLTDFDQIYALRISIEPMAVSAAMRTWDAAWRQFLANAVRDMDNAIAQLDIARFRRAHRDFHLGLMRGSGARIERLLVDLWDNSERFRLVYLHHDYEDPNSETSQELHVSQAEHRAILDAALKGNADLCGTSLVSHMQRAIDIVYDGAAVRPRANLSIDAIRQRGQSAAL